MTNSVEAGRFVTGYPAIDNRAWAATGAKLEMPILAVGGEKSFGPGMAAVMRTAATQVSEGVIADAGTGCWKNSRMPPSR